MAPWGFTVPTFSLAARVLSPGTERMVNFHVVTEGEALVCLPDGYELPAVAGDIVVLPHGHAHSVSRAHPKCSSTVLIARSANPRALSESAAAV